MLLVAAPLRCCHQRMTLQFFLTIGAGLAAGLTAVVFFAVDLAVSSSSLLLSSEDVVAFLAAAAAGLTVVFTDSSSLLLLSSDDDFAAFLAAGAGFAFTGVGFVFSSSLELSSELSLTA